MGLPTEERAVEALGGVLVCSVEFNPAEGAGGVLIDVCHSGKKCTPIRVGGLSTGDESKAFTAEITEFAGSFVKSPATVLERVLVPVR
jgi:hypothetical protein